VAEQSCGYQGYEFGAGAYPDSMCVGGRLHDADSDYANDEDMPCPMCRPLDAIAWWTERNAMFVEGDESEEETQARAREHAVSLVTDIRRNRGVETDLDALRAEVK
jgi:Zn ribbon nucleic-acid-binding protein